MRLPGVLLLLTFVAVCPGRSAADSTRVSPPGSLISADTLMAEVLVWLPEKWGVEKETKRYAGNGLYGYIDGGAELFFEFGFDHAEVYSLGDGHHGLTMERYTMTEPASAWGIYLARCGEETPLAGIDARNTGDRYQCSLVSGSGYIVILNLSGDSAALPGMVALAAAFLRTLPKGDPPKLLSTLPEENLIPGSVRLVRGPYALEPIYTFGDGDILQLGGRIFAVVGDYFLSRQDQQITLGGMIIPLVRDTTEYDTGSYTRIRIAYPDDSAASTAFANVAAGLDPESTIVNQQSGWLVFRDYQGRYGLVVRQGNAVNIAVHLPRPPQFPGNRK